MATSATFNTSNQYIKYRIECTTNWQDIANNISNVTVNVFFWRTNTGYTTAGAGTVYCAINGTTYTSSVTFSQKITENGIYLFSKTLNISHNADGTKTLSTAAYIEHAVFSSSSNAANFTLTTIPRTSSVTCNSFFIGDSTTINISRASSSFTHTLKYVYGDLTGTIATKTSETSIGWTPDKASFYSRIPNGTTGYGSITCETYSGTTLIGTDTTNFNAYAKEEEAKPSVSATIVDTNTDTIALTGDSSKLIKYLSKPKVTITATPKYSSTIKFKKILWGDGSTATDTATFSDGVTSNSLIVSATDSRNYTTPVSYDLSSKWVEYIKLAFSKITLSRTESTLSTANVKVSGNYFNGSFGKVTNSFTLKYRYKTNESGSSFTSYKTLTMNDIPKTNDTFDYTETLQNIDYRKEYIFEFVLEDEAMVVYSGEQKLEKGQAIFRIGEDYIRTNGKIIDQNGEEIAKTTVEDYSGLFENGLEVLESGWVTITPVANSPTAVYVTFKKHYNKIPVVLTTASSGVIGTQVLGTSTNGITQDGVNIVVTRTNTTPTSVYYYVLGEK